MSSNLSLLPAPDDSDLPPPNTRGKCEECSAEIDQWEVMGIVYPRHCERHAPDAASPAVLAAREAENQKRRNRTRQTIPALYREIALKAHKQYPREAWDSIRRWQPGEVGIERGWGLLVTGETGKYKSTMVCHHVADICLKTGCSIGFLSVPEFETIQRLALHGSDDEKTAAKLQLKHARRCRILILDDLGKESATEIVERELHSLIDSRLSKLRPTIVTMNTSFDDYQSRLSHERAKPFMRRLVDYNRVVFVA